MRNKIPFISVISIIGTTEESAVDPLDAVLDIRKELSKKVRDTFLTGLHPQKITETATVFSCHRDVCCRLTEHVFSAGDSSAF